MERGVKAQAFCISALAEIESAEVVEELRVVGGGFEEGFVGFDLFLGLF